MIAFFFAAALIGFLFLLFLREPIADRVNGNNALEKKLQKLKWFQKSYLAGIMLLLINAALFFGCLGILYALTLVFIPYIHLLVMIVAVVLSIWVWIGFNKAWMGSNGERIILALIGSSFYFGLTILFVYMYVGIEPYYPGEDTFMRSLGLLLASIITTVACIACFIITGFFNRILNSGEQYNTATKAKNSQ
ncbi:hypothetical protein [Ureibacillus sinduriensis]|uniref:hypothetical protein n=1 Tax=Ureibacillus sinduriensis TaxID=561440 RepID=UPI00068D2A31|nr:hypothetical protein [Ureibacillus sinduriensis]